MCCRILFAAELAKKRIMTWVFTDQIVKNGHFEIRKVKTGGNSASGKHKTAIFFGNCCKPTHGRHYYLILFVVC